MQVKNRDYYAFGLQHNTSWTRDNSSNNFLYDCGSEINTTTNWYDLPYRNYDPALGRFFQIDPLAHADHTLTPFHYAGNNPIGFNDPTGLIKRYDANGGMGDWEDDAGDGPVRNHDGGGESGGVPMSGDWVPEWTVYSGDEFREMAMRSGFWLSTDAGMVIGDPTKLEVTIRGIRDKFISNVLQEIWDQSSGSGSGDWIYDHNNQIGLTMGIFEPGFSAAWDAVRENPAAYTRTARATAKIGGATLVLANAALTGYTIKTELDNGKFNTHSIVNGVVTTTGVVLAGVGLVVSAPALAVIGAGLGIGYGIAQIAGFDDWIDAKTDNWGQNLIK